MHETITLPVRIGNDLDGYTSLVNIANQVSSFSNIDILFDMSYTQWFSGNLCALLGAIISILLKNGNHIKFRPSNTNDVRKLIEENGFGYRFFGFDAPIKPSAISFKEFDASDIETINNYLETELLNRPELPQMTILAKKTIQATIFEIFENARTHSGCSTVFACGQCFPQKNKINFTIVDVGVTIKKNVFSFLETNGEPFVSSAIEWALIEQNSTKTDMSGGFGLSLLQSFVKKNNGNLQIYSDNEFWELNKGIGQTQLAHFPFHGTLVNLEINMNDPVHYLMSSEIKYNDVVF